jgi:hypothetical protein
MRNPGKDNAMRDKQNVAHVVWHSQCKLAKKENQKNNWLVTAFKTKLCFGTLLYHFESQVSFKPKSYILPSTVY